MLDNVLPFQQILKYGMPLIVVYVFQIISRCIFIAEELQETLPVIFIDVRPVGKLAK